jgi:HAD superfamily hydrolase (TIGR01549 family)
MRFSLLLSDVDNTLFDFHSAERAAYAAVAARFSLPGDADIFALYKAINTRHWQRLRRGETTSAKMRLDRFRDFVTALGLDDADVQAISDFYVRSLGEQKQPVEGAEAFLSRVSAQMPVCLVTNGFAAVQHARFRTSPLRHHIQEMFISEEFENAKPHPEMLLAALQRFGITNPKHAVMIGDNEDTDILAAVNAGVPSILFTNGEPPPEHTQADFTAATLGEAADWILKA